MFSKDNWYVKTISVFLHQTHHRKHAGKLIAAIYFRRLNECGAWNVLLRFSCNKTKQKLNDMQKIKKIERKILQDDDDDVFIAMYLK